MKIFRRWQVILWMLIPSLTLAQLKHELIDFRFYQQQIFALDAYSKKVYEFEKNQLSHTYTLPKAYKLYAIAAPANQSHLYIADGAKHVFVIDAAQHLLRDRVSNKPEANNRQAPGLMIASPDGQSVYVADAYGQMDEPAFLHTIDARTDSVVNIAIKPHGAYGSYFGWRDGGITINAKGTKIYLTSVYDDGIYRFDTELNEFSIIRNFPDYHFIDLALAADQQQLFALTDRAVFTIDLASGQTKYLFKGNIGYQQFIYAAPLKRLFILDTCQQKIIVINEKGDLLKEIGLAGDLRKMHMDALKNKLYVLDNLTQAIHVIDMKSLQPQTSITLPLN